VSGGEAEVASLDVGELGDAEDCRPTALFVSDLQVAAGRSSIKTAKIVESQLCECLVEVSFGGVAFAVVDVDVVLHFFPFFSSPAPEGLPPSPWKNLD